MSAPRDNEHGQPVGGDVPGWKRREPPPRSTMQGRFCRLEPVSAGHADALHAASRRDPEGRNWTYMAYGPFANAAEHRAWIESLVKPDDPLFFTIVDSAGTAVGLAAYLRIDPANGVIEIGHLNFSPLMQRTPIATEAIFLMLQRAFDELGYRRVEWKCDSLNAPSRAAALRFGFQYEGLFRQAVIYKGRNRDTAWFAIVDGDWPALRAAYTRWLAPANFDAEGRQREKLSAFMSARQPS